MYTNHTDIILLCMSGGLLDSLQSLEVSRLVGSSTSKSSLAESIKFTSSERSESRSGPAGFETGSENRRNRTSTSLVYLIFLNEGLGVNQILPRCSVFVSFTDQHFR